MYPASKETTASTVIVPPKLGLTLLETQTKVLSNLKMTFLAILWPLEFEDQPVERMWQVELEEDAMEMVWPLEVEDVE